VTAAGGGNGPPPERRLLIDNLQACESVDSRGRPAVTVTVTTTFGAVGEVVILPDDPADPLRTVGAVNVMGPTIELMDAADQREFDRTIAELDGTPDKSCLGANALLGVSLAVARAAATSLGVPLFRHLGGSEAVTIPVPMVTVIGGVEHDPGGMQFQACMVVPIGATTFADASRCCSAVADALGHDVPEFEAIDGACELLARAIERAGYRPGDEAAIAIDPAATSFFHGGRYFPHTPRSEWLDAELMVTLYDVLAQTYPVVSIEDGMARDDWEGWKLLASTLGERVQLVAADLFGADRERLERIVRERVANAVLIDVGRIGTLTETLDAAKTAREGGMRTVMSLRSGRDEDGVLADLAVAAGADQIKVAPLGRSERSATCDRLSAIADDLGPAVARYSGKRAFAAPSKG
jgi:enolase